MKVLRVPGRFPSWGRGRVQNPTSSTSPTKRVEIGVMTKIDDP